MNPASTYRTFHAFACQHTPELSHLVARKDITDIERALLPAAEREVAGELRAERSALLRLLASLGLGSWVAATESEGARIALGIASLYERLYRRTVPPFAERVHRSFSREVVDIDEWTARAIRFVQDEAGGIITNVQGTTREEMIRSVRSVVEEAFEQQFGTDVAARRLRERLAGLHGNRATVISRTEILRSSNVATFEAGDVLVKEGYPMWKRWLWSGISRETHSAIDGQERPYGEYFDVAGEVAMYPLASSLSAKESVNCGCTHVLFIKP